MSSDAPKEMFYLKTNSRDAPTIILLHGIFCSHLEFTYVVPFLKDYNVILVDLPGHSRSRQTPFEITKTVESLRDMIKNETTSGQAHVVGLSFGGFVACQLARQHPEVVQSVFASGSAPFAGYQSWLSNHPRALYPILASLAKWCPDWLYWRFCHWTGLQEHRELRKETKLNFTFDMLTRGYGWVASVKLEDVIAINDVPVLVVAGGKQDNVEGTREIGQKLKVKNPLSKACVVRKAMHGWDLQFPQLFADGIIAWVEQKPLPIDFEELD